MNEISAELATEADPGPPEALHASAPAKTRVRKLLTLTIPTILTAIGLALIWEFLSFLDPSFWPEVILSRPSEIVPALGDAVTQSFVWQNFWVTFQETFFGFLAGAGSAFVLGVLVALSRSFSSAAYPLMVGINAVPRVALGPVFIAWFGFGITSKVALAATICFFPVLINTISGLTHIEENSVLLMRSLKATRFQTFYKLRLPAALPTIFAGLKTALSFALIGALVAELLGSNEGVGQLIETASFQLRMDDLFAYLALLGILGLLLDIVAVAIERKVIFWHGDPEEESDSE
jgi:NitT/TauT family transport system permease protein